MAVYVSLLSQQVRPCYRVGGCDITEYISKLANAVTVTGITQELIQMSEKFMPRQN